MARADALGGLYDFDQAHVELMQVIDAIMDRIRVSDLDYTIVTILYNAIDYLFLRFAVEPLHAILSLDSGTNAFSGKDVAMIHDIALNYLHNNPAPRGMEAYQLEIVKRLKSMLTPILPGFQ